MNKPNKKTEWEKKVREPLAYVQKWVTQLIDEAARHSPGYTPGERQVVLMNLNKINTELKVAKLILKEDVLPLLHQRDNEIREKIQGMKFNEVGFGHYKDCEKNLGTSLKGECGCGLKQMHASSYNMAIDDLLTYLSNREV